LYVIDIHAHLIPKDVVDRAAGGDGLDGLRARYEDGTMQIQHRQGYRYPFVPEFHDPAARLRRMDQLGIDAAIVSISPTFYFYWVSSADGSAHARAANDAIAAHVASAPARLAGLATLPMQEPLAAADELERAVTELALRGASVGPRVGDTYLDDPQYWPVLERAEALDVPLLVHPFYVGLRPGLPDFYLTNLIGNPLESTVCAARLILSGVLDRFPQLRLALTHGGGFLPYQIGRLDHGHHVRREAQASADPPSAYLRRFVFDTVTHRPEATAFLVSLVGADRVAFGTDLPFDMMAGPLHTQIPDGSIEPAQRDLISAGTARAWFGVFPSRDASPAAAKGLNQPAPGGPDDGHIEGRADAKV
jgi:aminocarboxymuconate-semialdehyde decarboxylase